MKTVFHDGHHYITDPRFEDVPDLADEAYARERAMEIGETATEETRIGLPDTNAEFADTVLMCMADDEGNVVSYINPRFDQFRRVGRRLPPGRDSRATRNALSSSCRPYC